MNTPAHVALNALALGRGRFAPHWAAISAGALLPDLPMVGFYVVERLGRGTPEHVIWGQLSFDPAWQNLFDAFNSLPLIGAAALFAWRAGATAALAFPLSMALHCLADLPLHREDAHAHFWPLTSWRFLSPVSYWDQRHGGLLFLAAELALLVGAPFVLRRRSRAWGRVGWVTLAATAAFVAFVALAWGPPGASARFSTAWCAASPSPRSRRRPRSPRTPSRRTCATSTASSRCARAARWRTRRSRWGWASSARSSRAQKFSRSSINREAAVSPGFARSSGVKPG